MMEKNLNSFLIILLIKLISFVSNIHANEVLGCGGFIKSSADLDFSKVEVALYTTQGSLKVKTDCSPSNGYYFIPLYDKGNYVIKVNPPPGWSFEPESVDVQFDGVNDICSLGKDINFNFKGFGITGKVQIYGNKTPAKGVQVELKSENNQKIGHTYTDSNGIFSFTPIIPGKYIVKATHEKWHFLNSEHQVTVQTGNTEIPANSLIVSGFNVVGRVLSEGFGGFAGVGLLLYNLKGQNTISKCVERNIPAISNTDSRYDEKPLCYTTTNKPNGEYIFENISSGKYLIVPYFENKNIKFHIEPKFLEVEVLKDTLTVPNSFDVSGISVSGKILVGPNGRGIPNANIKINGRDVAVTDKNGGYTLDNINTGTYTIQVTADNVQFNDHTVKISITNPALPDIYVNGFKVCGQVVSKTSHNVAITKQASTYHTEISTEANSGAWCLYLSNGKYLVEVLTSSEEKARGIQFFPLSQTIEVDSSPLDGIMFSQLKAMVIGQIKCLSDADISCHNTAVTLQALDSSGKIVSQPIVTNVKGGSYNFDNILPGLYEISVPNSKLCWESNSYRVNIKSAKESVPIFKHTGYIIAIASSHTTQISYKLKQVENAKSHEAILTPGLNSFCVEKAGTYDIKFSGCHLYDENVVKTFSTNSQTPLNVNAVKHLNTVKILSTDRVSDYQVKIFTSGKNVEEFVRFTTTGSKEDGYIVYKYDFYLKYDERVKITPVSDLMLFKPETKEIRGGSDCVDSAFEFTSTKGLLINGKTTPAINEAKITLAFPKNPELSSLVAMTNAKGEFKFGPIDSILSVELSAEKESYVFSSFDSATNTFKGHKLCEVIVTVKDESGNKLPGVLLSLSGAESYRKNLVTGEDGTIKFHSLSPSQYYLRAMMKEYEFQPNSKLIEVKEGATVVEELKGNRVAFSVYGSITSLNGEPFSNILVEAVSFDDHCSHHQEEATSEFNGHYRIRGLQPNCEYRVSLRSGNGINTNVDRSLPKEKIIRIENGDIRDVNFIGIHPITFVDVTARVCASQNDYYKSLKIYLYRRGSDTPLHSQRVDTPLNPKNKYNPCIMVFFPRIPFDGKSYSIELTTSLSDKNYKYNLPVAQFVANTSSYFTVLEFKPELRTENDLNQNSLSAIFLIALVGIIFFKQELAIELLTIVWNKVCTFVQEMLTKTKQKEISFEVDLDESEIDKIASSINAIKKKKSKKVN
uniref:Putative metalloproteinase-related collagenase pm5 n=1 Tax=Corethrella appendiculata TaxID=1370023 RepID=U5EYY7_9DIPT